MILPIYLVAYLFQKSSATCAGSTLKEVICEECGFNYNYQMRRSAWEETTTLLGVDGSKKAESLAEANLSRALGEGCDPVPCPACGRYQKNMVARARRLRFQGLLWTGLALFPFSLILGVAGLIVGFLTPDHNSEMPVAMIALLVAAGVAAGLAVTLPLLKCFLSRLYDPNARDRGERIRLGRALAGNRTAFDRDNVVPPAADSSAP